MILISSSMILVIHLYAILVMEPLIDERFIANAGSCGVQETGAPAIQAAFEHSVGHCDYIVLLDRFEWGRFPKSPGNRRSAGGDSLYRQYGSSKTVHGMGFKRVLLFQANRGETLMAAMGFEDRILRFPARAWGDSPQVAMGIERRFQVRYASSLGDRG
ncbi:hypothetical protein AKJ16_DCAP25583 [Drosera capensis]